MIDFLKGTVGKDYFSDRLYGCQEFIAEYLASKEPLHYQHLEPLALVTAFHTIELSVYTINCW